MSPRNSAKPSQLNQKSDKERLTGKYHPRKTRHDTKHAQDELDRRFTQMLEGQQSTILQRLVKENRELRNVCYQYQSKIESIILCSRNCLDIGNDMDLGQESELIPNAEPDRLDFSELVPASEPCLAKDRDSRSCRTNSPCFSFINGESILPQVALYLDIRESMEYADCSVNRLFEAIMTWKENHAYTDDLTLFHQYFLSDQPPISMTMEQIQRKIASPTFFQDLVAVINSSASSLHAGNVEFDYKGALQMISNMIRQRRFIAYLSYLVIGDLRSFYQSNAEFVSQFWAMYTYLTFLILPTESNLKKCPPFLWPTRSQLLFKHSGGLDFLAWPKLRSTLAAHHYRYDHQNFMKALVQNFRLSSFKGKDHAEIVFVTPNMSDLSIHPAFEAGIFDLGNFNVDSGFYSCYPELEGHLCHTCEEDSFVRTFNSS